VRQGLPIKYKSLSFLHRIVDIEILHAQNVFIDVQLAQVPRSRFDNELSVAWRTYHIIVPNACAASVDDNISLIGSGTEEGSTQPSSSSIESLSL
jgi:hypothetical protein